MRILVAGASGFIGSHIAAHLQAAGHEVIAAARGVNQARRRLPDLDWIACDFRTDRVEEWRSRLEGVDAVVNCVGVLQDGLGDDSRAVHVEGAAALFQACEEKGVRRVLHISAVGVEDASGSAYSRDKLAGEAALKDRDLDWLILRPSLVVARNVYGGTALIRSLCGVPFLTPVVGGEQVFRPIAMEDVCAAVAQLVEPDAPSCQSFDLAGPDPVRFDELVRAYRRWLGFGETRIWSVPRWLARPAFWFGDLLGWMGVRTSMRTNSLKQLDFDVEGNPEDWMRITGAKPSGFQAWLSAHPAGVQDRWQARLGFARPLARWVLGLYWLLTGVLSLTIAKEHAYQVLTEAGFDAVSRPPLLWFGSLFDIAVGVAMIAKWRVRSIAAIMILGTFGYIVTLSWTYPVLWADALGPILKVFPMMALALMIAGTEDER
ncbi:NAD(P)H-binding protein [Maricaulis parjimensis]|uniref:NAD(P)H-binding protein n=1 Tax=Maricaulis parjimensis TaxID=144023 RepID=UPI00193A143E|nr:NAD(P)H-binding protein [Maricaulis parjimensis]